MPDGPWVLPDEENGIFVRIVAKLERPGQPSCYTVGGPGYDTTEHPSLDEAKEAAEEERYEPFTTQVNPGWPPMPEIITAWPVKLYVKETTWPYWQGSATEIARLAKRSEERMNSRFIPFQKLARDQWYIRPGIPQRQNALDFRYTVNTRDWAGGEPTSDGLRDEIEARRALVRGITLRASVTDRTWSVVAIRLFRFVDIFDDIPLTAVETPGLPEATESITAPQLIEIRFETSFPAVRLRTIARTPYQAAELHHHMHPHIEAGARPQVWERVTASRLGVVGGAVIGAALGFVEGADAGIGAGVLSAYALGSFGDWVVRWAFPPLELVEAWERSRWTMVKTWFWQGLIFLLAVVGIILTIVLSEPSGSKSGSRSTTTTSSARP